MKVKLMLTMGIVLALITGVNIHAGTDEEMNAQAALQGFIEARKLGNIGRVEDYFTKEYVDQFYAENNYSLQKHFDTDHSYYLINELMRIKSAASGFEITVKTIIGEAGFEVEVREIFSIVK